VRITRLHPSPKWTIVALDHGRDHVRLRSGFLLVSASAESADHLLDALPVLEGDRADSRLDLLPTPCVPENCSAGVAFSKERHDHLTGLILPYIISSASMQKSMSQGSCRTRRREQLAWLVAVWVLGASVAVGCGGKESPAPERVLPPSIHPGKTKIGEITVEDVTQGWGTPQLNLGVMGGPLTIGGESYSSGIGTHAVSHIEISFPPNFKKFSGACGVDEYFKGGGSIVCKVAHGEQVLFESPLLKGGMKAASFSVAVSGLSKLTLLVEDGGDNISGDHADWVDLQLK
jgi:hypothetical protein